MIKVIGILFMMTHAELIKLDNQHRCPRSHMESVADIHRLCNEAMGMLNYIADLERRLDLLMSKVEEFLPADWVVKVKDE